MTEELRAEVQHLRRRLAQAIPILEALANSDMPYNDNSGDLECQYCNLAQHSEFTMRAKPSEHDKDCPIRLASEWLQV